MHSMLCQKGWKIMLCTQYRYIQCYVKRVKRLCYVETRDIHIFAHNFLNIQPILNPKKVWKAETWTFLTTASNVMYVEMVEGYFNLSPLWHALTYIVFDGMVDKSYVSAFQNFFLIENRLNIKKVMSKNVLSLYSIFYSTFDPFNMSNITLYTVLCKSRKHHFQPCWHE